MNEQHAPLRIKRTQRRDGPSTRSVILEMAGKVFAERGFAEATSKEICERASANNAAVNYYFGGKESLYEEVLIEAHRQLSSLEDMDEVIESDYDPKDKLRIILEQMIHTALTSSELWGVKIFLRELASPSQFAVKNMMTTALPKAMKFCSLIQQITGLPADSEQLQRATGFVLIPCISFILFPEALRSAIFPANINGSKELIDDLLTYVMGGLRALSEHKKN